MTGIRKTAGPWMLGLAFALCLFCVAFTSGCGRDEQKKEKPPVESRDEVVKGGYKIVGTGELKGWLDKIDPRWQSDRDSLLIVDTMPYADGYRKHHIPYAAHFEFPPEEMDRLDDRTRAQFEIVLGPDKKRKTVFYSEDAKCGRSHNGAKWAVKLGYTNVYRYPAGIRGWMEAGYETATAE